LTRTDDRDIGDNYSPYSSPFDRNQMSTRTIRSLQVGKQCRVLGIYLRCDVESFDVLPLLRNLQEDNRRERVIAIDVDKQL